MPKFTPKPGMNWLVEIMKCTPDGKPVYTPDGKYEKIKIPMTDATLPNGHPQSLYFGPGHSHAGVFKGMAKILIERGFDHEKTYKLKAQLFPESYHEDMLEKNALEALNAIPLLSMH
ncbi:hypothetical protein C0995_013585, partial [Termitomyces sp. Mi166